MDSIVPFGTGIMFGAYFTTRYFTSKYIQGEKPNIGLVAVCSFGAMSICLVLSLI